MAQQDPYDPYGFEWPPPGMFPDAPVGGEQQFDPSSAIAGSIFDIPTTVVAPPEPPAPAPTRTVYGVPIPEAYDDAESRGGANSARFDPERGTYVDPDGNTAFPFGQQSGGTPLTPGYSPIPAPRTDAARIGMLGGPSQAEEVARSGEMRLSPEDEAQIEIDGDPLAGVQVPAPDYGEVDAISGGGIPAQLYDEGVVKRTGRPVAGQTMGQPEEPEEYLTDAELDEKYAALAISDPAAFARIKVKKQAAREDFLATQQMEANREDREMAEKTFKIEQDARLEARRGREENAAAMKKLAETPIDNEAWMDSRSPLQTIAAYVSAIVGGMAASANGGRNVGLDAIQRTIDQHIETQKANHANKRAALVADRSAIDDQYALDMDAAKSFEVKRQALYENARRDIQIKMQQYDRRGTTAIALAEADADLFARQQAAAAKAEEEDYKRMVADRTFQLEQDKHLLDVAKAEPDILLKMKKLQGGGPAVKYPPEHFKALGLQVPPIPMSDKEHKAWMAGLKSTKELGGNDAKSRKETADASEAEAKAAAAERGYFVFNPETREPLVDKKGKPVYIMDATARTDLDKKIAAAKGLRRLADLVTAAKNNHGGNIKALGSEEAQEMQTLVAMIDFETFKLFDLGAPSEGDKGLAEAVRGGVDPSSFIKKSAAGFQKYAEQAEAKLNTALGAKGIEPVKFTRRSDATKAKASVADEAAAHLTKAAEYAPAYDPTKPWIAPSPLDAGRNKVTDEQFFILASEAELPGDRGDLARKHLKDIANGGGVAPTVRAKAKQLLDALPGANPRTDEAR